MMEAHHSQRPPGSWPPALPPQHRFQGIPQRHPLQLPHFPGGPMHQGSRPSGSLQPSSTVTSLQQASPPDRSTSPASPSPTNMPTSSNQGDMLVPSTKGKRGRPRKHAPKLPLPPLYVFIRNLLHSPAYNPSTVAWVDESAGCFKVTSTTEFAKTWGRMKSNRSEEMNYEKMSRAMRYHYGCERQGRKGHLAMVKEKRLYYKFGELARNWREEEVAPLKHQCHQHPLCRSQICLWTKE